MKKNILLISTFSAPFLLAEGPMDMDCISDCNVQNYRQGEIVSAGIDGGFSVGASFLYQQASVDRLEPVKSIKLSTNTPTEEEPLLITESMPNLDYKWKPGVRVRAGYIICPLDQFRVDVIWTHLQGEGKSFTSFNDPTFLLGSLKPGWFPFLLGANADRASSKWESKLNVLDGTFGRDFFLGRWLTFHPYAGVRGAWINQDYLAKYHGAWNIDTTGQGNVVLDFLDTKFKGKNDFTGAGLLFGIETNWYLTCSFSLFSNFKTSLLYGKFEIEQIFDGQVVIPVSGTPTILVPEIITETRNIHRIRPTLEGESGIRWEQFFCDDSYKFLIGLSYEFSFWFCQNIFENIIAYLDPIQNPYTTPFIESRNLQFQGINVQVGFDF